MRKKVVFLLLILCCCGLSKAQQVVSSGGYDVKSEISVNWILGGSLSDIPINNTGTINIVREIQLVESPISVKLYPIPANDFINIEIAPVDTGRLILELFNISGVKVLNKVTSYQPVVQLNIQDIPSGIYFLKVLIPQMDRQFKIEKIIKK